jgi:hypothetical protein
MTAKELRELTLNNCKSEIERIESEMVKAAKLGQLKTNIPNLSAGAREYFIEHGYWVRIVLRAEELKDGENMWSISWEAKQRAET